VTVHFIGAGPGAPDLITVRGIKLLQKSRLVLYAGSLIPDALVNDISKGIRLVDTASLTLDEIISEIQHVDCHGHDVARLHSGDPSLYGAIGEQIRRLDELGIKYDITPGVPAYAAVASVLGKEFTLPGVAQTLILTRTAVRASSMPPGENLENMAQTGATLAIHLSINNLVPIVRTLLPYYGKDCPVVVAYRVTWPDELVIIGNLGNIRDKVKQSRITRTALILVGKVLEDQDFQDSKLYDPEHSHVMRQNK